MQDGKGFSPIYKHQTGAIKIVREGAVTPPIKRAIKKINLFIYGCVFLIVGFVVTFFFHYYPPDNYYVSPIGRYPKLAATFGEVRPDHFHLGLDIRTGGRENMPVIAIADGYISRVSISATGYGKALYVRHPNGMTSLYAHLNSFTREVEKVVLQEQMSAESWETDIIFPIKHFPVSKGSVIALSGNTGSSKGPHLHFELRDILNRKYVNPVLAGLQLKDGIPPTINSLFLYSGLRSVYNQRGVEIRIRDAGNSFHTMKELIIVRDSIIRLGIEVTDRQEESKFRLGISEATLFFDDLLVYRIMLDSIPFEKERYVNASIDYEKWTNNSRKIHLLFTLPGNKLPASILSGVSNGSVSLGDQRPHRLHIVLRDASKNKSTYYFKIKYRPGSKTYKQKNESMLQPRIAHKVTTRNAVVYFSPRAFYDTIPFLMTEQSSMEGAISNEIQVGSPSIPLHTPYRIQLKTFLKAANPLRKFTLMQLTNREGVTYSKGSWKGDYLDASFHHFGKVILCLDTTGPTIDLIRKIAGTVSTGTTLELICRDNCGPPESFRATIDGKWIPMEQRNERFIYQITDTLRPGIHNLFVQVEDKAGNMTSKRLAFQIK